MHEIRATMPPDCVAEAVLLAHHCGISRVSVGDVFVHGPNQSFKLLSVETSTPNAKHFVDALLNSPFLSEVQYTLTSREVRAIVSNEPAKQVTRPLSEPFPNVIQDLWQLSHVTLSYVARAAAGAMILATGIIENNPLSIVLAALFLPFLSQVLAVSFGTWSRDWQLVWHGSKALIVSVSLALLGGFIVGWIMGEPIRFEGFRSPAASAAISTIIGVTAGLSLADDTGRRYLIGVAAAVQLALFPVWLGTAIVVGLPPATELLAHLEGFSINLMAISLSSVASYAVLHLNRSWRAPRSRL
jgi:hypothetical protein